MFKRAQRSRAVVLLACTTAILGGCVPWDPETGASPPELVLGGGPLRPPASDEYVEAESNDSFDRPNLVAVVDSVDLVGAMTAGAGVVDRDVYELGPANAGDRVLADLTVDVTSDIQLALFDDQERILGYTNPASVVSGPARIDLVLRESTSQLFVVAATGSSSLEARSYAARLEVQPGYGVPGYRPQVLVLDFQGGEGIRIGNRRPIDIPAFDAANIGPEFDGYTETMIRLVMEKVAEDYAGLDIAIYRSDDPGLPEGDHSTIYYGTYDDRLLGLADSIDPFNGDLSQAAVLYTDTFSLFRVLSPDVEAMAQVLANVTSHEAGHLLGLRHTADARGIMDITASARQMMLDQWFSVSDLHETVMSVGVQDAPATLAWTLGGTPPRPPAHRLAVLQRALEVADDPNDFYIPRSDLATCFCPDCARHRHP